MQNTAAVLTIRKASEEDIDLIRDLSLYIWPKTYATILSPGQIEYMLNLMYSRNSLLKQMREEHCVFLLGYLDNRPVAFASYSEIGPDIFKLHKIYVVPEIHGQGVGRQLIDHVIENAKKSGASRLQLTVNRNNPAKDFYKKLGFKILLEKDFDIGNGYLMEDYVMEKDITL